MQGYPNTALTSQPVFLLTESQSTGKVTNISFSKDLSPDFRDFIVSVSDQFSPPGRTNSNKYTLLTKNLDSIPFFDMTTNGRLLAELPRISENVKILSLLKNDTSLSNDGKISE